MTHINSFCVLRVDLSKVQGPICKCTTIALPWPRGPACWATLVHAWADPLALGYGPPAATARSAGLSPLAPAHWAGLSPPCLGRLHTRACPAPAWAALPTGPGRSGPLRAQVTFFLFRCLVNFSKRLNAWKWIIKCRKFTKIPNQFC